MCNTTWTLQGRQVCNQLATCKNVTPKRDRFAVWSTPHAGPYGTKHRAWQNGRNAELAADDAAAAAGATAAYHTA